jgi:hypothetical protein
LILLGISFICCFWCKVYIFFLCIRVGEGIAMAEPPAQLNEKSDDPDIGQEVVVAPVVTQVVVVAPDISQVNAAEPSIDEADAAPDISVNTGHLFLNAACLKIGMN